MTAHSRSSTRRAQGTEAATMAEQVPDETKKARIERLVELVQHVAAARNLDRVGRVEDARRGEPDDASLLRGRTRRNTTVNFAGTSAAAASSTSIEDATSTTLRGVELAAVAA